MMILNLILLFALHPIHVSVTEIEFSEKNKSLQVTSRIFIDDLELSVQKQTHDNGIDLLNPQNGKTTDDLVKGYLLEHLKVSVDGKAAKFNYLAHEIDDLAIICYLEIEHVKKLKQVEVRNDVIQDVHDDQSNLVHVTYKGPVKSARLVRDHPTFIFRFD